MKSLCITCLFLFSSLFIRAQTFNSFYAAIIDNTSEGNLSKDLITYVNFGTKNVGSKNLTDAQNWIVNRYQQLGYSSIKLQPFTYSKGTSNNIIITKTGTIYPDTYIIIDGHYDTINGVGANDNGSGTVLLMELARLLKDIDTEYSIKFIHFSGEEDGLVGSEFYVKKTVIPENLEIRLVFNIDQVGGLAGATNDTIVCERDESAPETNNTASKIFTTKLAKLMELYSTLDTEFSHAYASDYMPFESNNEVITGLFEKVETPFAHTSNDIISNMNIPYLYQVTKGALGATLDFAKAYKTLNTDEIHTLENSISVIPHLADGVLHITFKNPIETPVAFKLVNPLGENIYETLLMEQQQSLVINTLTSANYKAVFKLNNKQYIKTLVIN